MAGRSSASPTPRQRIERLKEEGYWVYGTDPEGEPPWEVDLTGKVVLCFGGEEKGLRARTRQLCDRLIGLPMRGRVGSLNISTAAAAVLYEAVRQRMLGPADDRERPEGLRLSAGSGQLLEAAEPGARPPA